MATGVYSLAIQAAPLVQQPFTPDGRLASLTDANNNATNFTHDRLDRLATFSHAYNKVNQRVGQTVDSTWLSYPTGAPGTIGYTANSLNQYTAVTGLAPAYDANGNLTGDGTYGYGYDADNRMTSATLGA